MECRSCSDALTALLDGELDPHEQDQVEGHLNECTDCWEEYSSLSYAYELTNQISLLEPASELWQKIESEIGRRGAPPFWERLGEWFSRPWVPATAGLGAAALLVASLLMIPTTSPVQDEFATFIHQREQMFQENTAILFDDDGKDRDQSRRNPFVQPVSHVQYNPFRR